MSVRSTSAGILASVSVLAMAWWIGPGNDPGTTAVQTTSLAPTGDTSASTGSSSSGSSSSGSTSTGSSSSAATSGSQAAVDGTYTGDSVSTRFGDVQVSVTISGGRITDVTALHLTDHDGRSVSISNRAAPILRESVLSAQSASVSMVSGATYTSRAYLTSLQSALDQAGL